MKKLWYVIAALMILSGLAMVGYSIFVTPTSYTSDPTVPQPAQKPPKSNF